MEKKLFQEINSCDSPAEKNFQGYWPIIRKCLRLVQVFTGEKVDQVIDQIIEWGDQEYDKI